MLIFLRNGLFFLLMLVSACSFYNVNEPPASMEHNAKKMKDGSFFLVVVINPNHQKDRVEACGVFQMPGFNPLPNVPDIPEEIRNDYQQIASYLLDYIVELRKHNKKERYVIKKAYRQYLKKCQVNNYD
mgnify:CR=1 FL=1